jgi:hypothetical protein
MFMLQMLVALLMAMVLAMILTAVLGRRAAGPGAGFLLFFLVLFLATWAGGLWLVPQGPNLWGVPIVSYVLVGLVLALILAAVSPPGRGAAETQNPAPDAEDTKAAAATAFGLMFWVTLAVLAIAIGVRYWLV